MSEEDYHRLLSRLEELQGAVEMLDLRLSDIDERLTLLQTDTYDYWNEAESAEGGLSQEKPD